MAKLRLSYVSPVNLAALRIKGCDPASVSQVWSKLFNWLARGKHHSHQGKGYGLTYCERRCDQFTPLKYIAAVEKPQSWQACDNYFMTQERFYGGAYSVLSYRGPYDDISNAAAYVEEKWQPPDSVRSDPKRPIVTLFHTDPRSTPANEQIADICVPISVQFAV